MVCEDCNENAECIEGKCVCKENYTGDGTLCEQVTGKFKPQLYFNFRLLFFYF